jgi:predicted DNA-binding protein
VRTAGRKTSSLGLYVSLNATYVARIPDLVTPGIQTLTIVSPLYNCVILSVYDHRGGFFMSVDAAKVGRTVRLSPDINHRLVALCAHLGVNPNAYLVGEIGKSVARDELTYRLTSQTNDFFRSIQDGMAAMNS